VGGFSPHPPLKSARMIPWFGWGSIETIPGEYANLCGLPHPMNMRGYPISGRMLARLSPPDPINSGSPTHKGITCPSPCEESRFLLRRLGIQVPEGLESAIG